MHHLPALVGQAFTISGPLQVPNPGDSKVTKFLSLSGFTLPSDIQALYSNPISPRAHQPLFWNFLNHILLLNFSHCLWHTGILHHLQFQVSVMIFAGFCQGGPRRSPEIQSTLVWSSCWGATGGAGRSMQRGEQRKVVRTRGNKGEVGVTWDQCCVW